MDLREYRGIFDAGEPVKTGACTGLMGRILRGKTPEEFVTTTCDLDQAALEHGRVVPNRPLVLLVDGDTLADLVGLSGNTYEMLRVIGYDPVDIQQHYVDGLDFKLVVFADDGGSMATLGTWDNMLELAKKLHPSIGAHLDAYRAPLKAHTFDQIVALSGESTWVQVTHDHPHYMSPARLQDAFDGRITSQQGLVLVRRFLFDSLHLRKLYRGDGFTYDSAGRRQVREYVVPTTPLASLGELELIDLPKLRVPTAVGWS